MPMARVIWMIPFDDGPVIRAAGEALHSRVAPLAVHLKQQILNRPQGGQSPGLTAREFPLAETETPLRPVVPGQQHEQPDRSPGISRFSGAAHEADDRLNPVEAGSNDLSSVRPWPDRQAGTDAAG